ncbi:hypothetical protein [Kitasatospora sp. NBC_00315]|uniref:hypothetical protein n=1 Tax=Kitasatospora sp. NBC_00315 TaxID=2975963 RepID=UPI003252B3AF
MTTEQPPAAPRPSRGLVLAVLAVLALLLAVVATVALWPRTKPVAQPPPPSASPSPTPSPTPTPTPTKVLPYPFFTVGTCLDHPQLSKVITKAEARPCEGPHDAEAIADVLLPEGLTSDSQIGRALLVACKAAVDAAEQRQGDTGPYYSRPLGPYLAYYQQGMRDATCTLAASNKQDGRKLTGHLH